MKLQFTKMHGLGNDFVILNGLNQPIELDTDTIRLLGDRHLGIGFDQLLILQPPTQPNTDFSLRIFNTDGSETGQCGNGVRCIGRFIWSYQLSTKTQLFISTSKTTVELRLNLQQQITVNMGLPQFEPSQIPFIAPEKAKTYTLKLDDRELTLSTVSMGNPHAVLVVPDIRTAPVHIWGPRIASHADFPESVNVGFMEIINREHIRLRVYERGAGETLACGSGACAAVAIGQMRELLNKEVQVELPGGNLYVSRSDETDSLWLTGPSIIVFTGEWLNRKD